MYKYIQNSMLQYTYSNPINQNNEIQIVPQESDMQGLQMSDWSTTCLLDPVYW